MYLVLSMMREATDAQVPTGNWSADIVSFLEANELGHSLCAV